MAVLARPTANGILAALTEIGAALAQGVQRAIDARMEQIRSEIEMYACGHRAAPHNDDRPAIR